MSAFITSSKGPSDALARAFSSSIYASMVFMRWQSQRTNRSGVRSIMDSEFTTRLHPVQTIFQTLPKPHIAWASLAAVVTKFPPAS
jgi:hypothetical protein